MRFKIDWASLIVERKFTVFALFYFVFEGNFQVQAPRGAYIWWGDLTESFLRYEFGGLISGGAYTWRDLFSEFYGMKKTSNNFHQEALTIILYLVNFACIALKLGKVGPATCISSFNPCPPLPSIAIERIHVTSRRPCWCLKPVLWELIYFVM